MRKHITRVCAATYGSDSSARLTVRTTIKNNGYQVTTYNLGNICKNFFSKDSKQMRLPD